MKHADAVKLIEKIPVTNASEIWYDLGCGDGTFTYALDELLPAGSTIHAIDLENKKLSQSKNVTGAIEFHQLNFIENQLPIKKVDGILMANSLHYVQDKKSFLATLNNYMNPSGKLCILEYDTLQGNPWVPYPIDFINLNALLDELGFYGIEKIGDYSSRYGNGNIYSCLARKS